MMRAKTFGTTKELQTDASPTLQVGQNGKIKYPPFLLFVTSLRPEAIIQCRKLKNALDKADGECSINIVPGKTHAEMNVAFSDPESPVCKKVLTLLKGEEEKKE